MDAEEARIKMMEYFKFLIDDVLGMLIYGSVATGASTERSDIDVCVVAFYEYFYGFRKLWEDQRERQRLSKEEALELFVTAR